MSVARRRPTIQDVALAAGVSVATVSRSLAGRPNVARPTRDRVIEIARQLDYAPDPAASRLAAGRTRTIAVLVTKLSSWYFSTVVAGIEEVCSAAGYDVLVLGASDRQQVGRLLHDRFHLERRCDGLIAVDVQLTDDDATAIASRRIALATVGTSVGSAPSVRIDNREIGRLAGEHLVGLGHRRLAVIGSSADDPIDFDIARHRFEGFANALQAGGLPVESAKLVGGDFTIEGGERAMCSLLADGDPPTAVFAMSDEMAFGALVELRRRGLRAPSDMSVVGVDDHEFSRVVSLTTVRQPVIEHGVSVAHVVLDALSRGPAEKQGERVPHGVTILAPVELVVRASTGRPEPSNDRW